MIQTVQDVMKAKQIQQFFDDINNLKAKVTMLESAKEIKEKVNKTI